MRFPAKVALGLVGCGVGGTGFLVYLNRALPEATDEPNAGNGGPRSFSIEELKQYNGHEGRPVYISVRNTVFQVPTSRYGPGCSYNAFAGKDCTIPLGKMLVEDKECNLDWTILQPNATWTKTVDEWDAYYRKRYPVVGVTRLEELKKRTDEAQRQKLRKQLEGGEAGQAAANKSLWGRVKSLSRYMWCSHMFSSGGKAAVGSASQQQQQAHLPGTEQYHPSKDKK